MKDNPTNHIYRCGCD